MGKREPQDTPPTAHPFLLFTERFVQWGEEDFKKVRKNRFGTGSLASHPGGTPGDVTKQVVLGKNLKKRVTKEDG